MYILFVKLSVLLAFSSVAGCHGASSIAFFLPLETQWSDCSHYIKEIK